LYEERIEEEYAKREGGAWCYKVGGQRDMYEYVG
jgi:hypothetical protein